MSVDPDTPPPEALGDILGRWLADPDWCPETAKPVGSPENFDDRIRSYAKLLGEDPELLLKRAKAPTALARLVRLLIGDPMPTSQLSVHQTTFEKLHEIKRERPSLKGEALWEEVGRQAGQSPSTAKRAVARYNAYLRKAPVPATLAEIFSPEFSTDKVNKKRGRKPTKTK